MWGLQRAEWASEILQWALSFTVPTLLLCEGHRERKGPARSPFQHVGLVFVAVPGALSQAVLMEAKCPYTRLRPGYAQPLPATPASSPIPGRKIPYRREVRPHSLPFPPLQTDQCGLPVPSGDPLDEGSRSGSCRPPQGRPGVAAVGGPREQPGEAEAR